MKLQRLYLPSKLHFSWIFYCNDVFAWVSTCENFFQPERIGSVFNSGELCLILASIDFVGTKSVIKLLIFLMTVIIKLFVNIVFARVDFQELIFQKISCVRFRHYLHFSVSASSHITLKYPLPQIPQLQWRR